MPAENAAAACTLTSSGAVTTLVVAAKCKVTYEFDTRASSSDKLEKQVNNLTIPYAVAINGKGLPEHSAKPGVLTATVRRICLFVESGSKVELFLNSDAHPGQRKAPVYAVRVGRNDVLVRIVEKLGRIGHERSTLRAPVCKPGGTGGRQLDVYDAVLTGDIWMEISHVYTADEACALMTPGISSSVRDAVRSIYAGLSSPELTVTFPANDSGSPLTLRVRFLEEMQNNVRLNTTHCPWLSGILPRTHPLAFAALLTEAHAAGVTELRVTSGWRPSVGSIAHRAGLGLDINYAEAGMTHLALNRESLTDPTARQQGNVTTQERSSYSAYAKAHSKTSSLMKKLGELKQRLAGHPGPAERQQLQDQAAATAREIQGSKTNESDSANTWANDMTKQEPSLVHGLRERLGSNSLVRQIFDPWYMDANTHDAVAPSPNAQFSPNERLHKNHLHITVMEPKILP